MTKQQKLSQEIFTNKVVQLLQYFHMKLLNKRVLKLL